jgi:hypothetical protein
MTEEAEMESGKGYSDVSEPVIYLSTESAPKSARTAYEQVKANWGSTAD